MFNKNHRGMVLPVVIAFIVIFTLVGFAILTISQQEIIQTRIEVDKTKAFYYAEGGLAKLSESLEHAKIKDLGAILKGEIAQGEYQVDIDTNGAATYAISSGKSGVITKIIKVKLNFLAAPFEDAIYAMNSTGTNWALQLRGTGNPVSTGSGQKGGRDIINGNISVNGDVDMYDQSQVKAAPAPNTWNLQGDVGATDNINVLGSASIAGARNPHETPLDPIDLVDMDYIHNNNDSVSQIFSDAHVTSGHLPSGNALRDVFFKNPSDRAAECASTTGDDFFFEPSSITIEGNQYIGATPIHVGDNVIYYVDGDVWVHSKQTYGFLMDGKATIVATGNIHICDNIQYKDANSMLGLIALGKYDSSGKLISGGDIYFGDPRYGTMYVASAMMFAAHDFLFNTDPVSRQSAEPTTGFIINGCFGAMNDVSIDRDWYTNGSGKGASAKAAHYDPATGQWLDAKTGKALTATEIGTLRHYQMIINYDARVRSPDTQPPGLPRGSGSIFTGFTNWEEL